jgi:hypothetical protein
MRNRSQQRNMLNEQVLLPFQQIHGEQIGAPRSSGPTVLHEDSLLSTHYDVGRWGSFLTPTYDADRSNAEASLSQPGLFVGEPVVHFSPVTNFNNMNDKLFVYNFVNDSVVALADAISFLP